MTKRVESRPLKDRIVDRILGFFKDHPTYTKAYVPTIVTVSLTMQILQGCC